MEKRIVKNSIYNILYKILNIIFPIIIAARVGRVLLPEGVGKVAYAQNIVTYFTFVAALGLSTYGTREIAIARHNEEEKNIVFTQLFSINAISTTICILLYYMVASRIGLTNGDLKLFYVAGISIILNYFNVDWLYQGLEEYKHIAIRSTLIKILSIILVFTLVNSRNDYILYALIHCIALAGNYFINFLYLKGKVKFVKTKLNAHQHLKPLFLLFASNIAIELYTLFDTTMLGMLTNDEIVGYYTYSMRTSKIVITILVAMSSVLIPRLSQYWSANKVNEFKALSQEVLEILIYFATPCCIGLILVSSYVITILYGQSFLPADGTLKILSLLIIPVSLNTFLGGQLLCSMKKEKKMLIAVSTGAITNIILNRVLIPFYMDKGAAIASVISEAIVLVIDWLMVKQSLDIKLSYRNLISQIFAASCMTIVVLFTQHLVNSDFMSMLLSCFLGAGIYFAITYCSGNKNINKILHLLKIRS